MDTATEERFWTKVARGADSACWPWTASVRGSGYGQFWHAGRLEQAHRVAWTLTHGALDTSLHLHHACGNRTCCNPRHLSPVTRAEHGAEHRSVCVHGDDARRTAPSGRTYCSACNRARVAAWKARQSTRTW